jgi:CNT family concentrative nucleoside transporter
MKRPKLPALLLMGLCVLLMGAGVMSGGGGEVASEGVTAAAAASQEAPTQLGGTGQSLDTPLFDRLRSVFGVLMLLGVAWILSNNRAKIPWRLVAWGLGLQLLFAVFILKTPAGADIFQALNTAVVALLAFTVEGARFIFGDLVLNTVPVGTGGVGAGDFQATSGTVARTGAFFAFNVLPTIIFFSSLMTVLYHLGIMQIVVKGIAWVMQRTMRTSGAETLSAAGNIFVGQTEAPLLIKPFVSRMTQSELMAVMTGGFATVAGGVLAAYVGLLVTFFPDIAGHLIAASVMSAPAALMIAKIMHPEDGTPETAGQLVLSHRPPPDDSVHSEHGPDDLYVPLEIDRPDVNAIDAAARGASEGLQLALNVAAMLLAFIALIALINAVLGGAFGLIGIEGVTLEGTLGWLLAPVTYLMGVPWVDAAAVGELMGIKTVLNEFVAYIELSSVLGGEGLQPRSVIIATYALSGFANFSSIAIQIGGIGGIAPERRSDLSKLGLRAMIGGSLAAFLTATVAGMIV